MPKQVKTENTNSFYAAPKLTTYGGMAELTANGSKPGNENEGNFLGNNSNDNQKS